MKSFHPLFVYMIVTIFFIPTGCDVKGSAGERYSLGIDYAIVGEFKKARAEFEKALQVDRNHQPAQESLKVIEDLLDNKLNDKAVIHFFKGISFLNDQHMDEAVGEFSRAIALNPGFANAHYERGMIYGRKGQYDLAVSEFTRVIELNPKDAPAFNNRGLAYAKGEKNYDRAFKDFNRAIELDPVFAEAYDNRGIAYQIIFNNKEKACEDWKRACELNQCNNYELAKKNGYCL